MRRILAKADGRAVLLAASTTLAFGLVATLPTASQAATGRPVTRQAATNAAQSRRAPAGLTRRALAQLAPLGPTSSVQVSTHARTALVTGRVESTAGQPFGGACVTAAGPAGDSSAVTAADGRYLVTGLRPGRYRLRIGLCSRGRRTAGRAPVISLWHGLPAVVAVRAGQVVTLPPAMIRSGAQPRLAGRLAGQPARAPNDSISGKATGNGHPLAGVCVDATPVNGGVITQAITSKTGRYRISGLAPGSYQVAFADFSCQGGNWLTQWYPGMNTPFIPDHATVFKIRSGRHFTGINGHLKLGGQISGTVRSRSGKKLSGICVNVSGTVSGGFVGIGLSTDKNGSFAVHSLFPGSYTAEFSIGCGSKGNYAFQWWRGATSSAHATVVKITGHRVFRTMDPVLGPGATVAGQVRGRNAAGPPLAGVCVSTFGSDGNDYADAITGPNGRYGLPGLASGRYHIQFDPTCGFGPPPVNYLGRTLSVSVIAGRTISGFNAYLPPGAILSGTVTDTHGHPAGSVCVALGDPNGDATRTSGTGTYSIIGIQPGSYTVEFVGGCGNSGSLAPQFFDNESDPQAPDLVKFTGGKTTANIDAVMRPGGTISGVVTDPAGHRLSGVCVGTATAGVSEFGGFTAAAVTRAGKYRVANLAPGPYQIVFNCGGGRYAVQWFRGQSDPASADSLSVNAGVVTRASAALRLAGRIAGTVVDKAGHRLSNVCVSVQNARDRTVGSASLATVSDGGRYQVGGLAAGTYLVQFSQCLGKPRDGAQWYRNKTTAMVATPVRVTAGRTTEGISAVMAAGGSIAGIVTGPSGQPVRGFCVEAIDLPAQTVSVAMTTKTGRYAFTGLATGRYSLDFLPCSPGGPNLAAVTRPGKVRVTAPRAVTGADLRLRRGGSVSGRVVGAGPPKAPQQGACVQLVPTNSNDSGGFAVTDRHGRYVAANLAAGTYRVYFGSPFCEFPIAGLAPVWYNGRPTQATANLVTVAAGRTTTGIDAALPPFGSITGTVTDGAHAAVPGECVTAVPVGASAGQLAPALSEIAISTGTGGYALDDLLPGRYKVEFAVGCGDSGFATQWWRDARSASSATVITVRYATVARIDATLRR